MVENLRSYVKTRSKGCYPSLFSKGDLVVQPDSIYRIAEADPGLRGSHWVLEILRVTRNPSLHHTATDLCRYKVFKKEDLDLILKQDSLNLSRELLVELLEKECDIQKAGIFPAKI